MVAAPRQDLRDSIAVERKFDEKLDGAFSAFETARGRGEFPPPVFLRISGSDTPPRSPCLGVLQGQLAELIDPTLLFELCFYYDERDGVGQNSSGIRWVTENEVLPRMKGNSNAVLHRRRNTARSGIRSHTSTGCASGAGTSRRSISGRSASSNRLNEPSKPAGTCRPTVGGTIDVGGASTEHRGADPRVCT